jgi:hypothetical protein
MKCPHLVNRHHATDARVPEVAPVDSGLDKASFVRRQVVYIANAVEAHWD